MCKFITLAILLMIQFQGFCDSFYVATHVNVNDIIDKIHDQGGKVIDIKTTANDHGWSHTIIYRINK